MKWDGIPHEVFAHALYSARYNRTDQIAVLFAEYQTHWQLSLDGNLPGETRCKHREISDRAKRHLVEILVDG